MSITSNRSVTSSLRKSIGNTSSRKLTDGGATSKKVLRFQLPHNTRVRSVLQDFVNGQNFKEYEQLVCAIRDNELGNSELQSLLEEASQCVSLLDHELRHFVEAILSLNWVGGSPDLIRKYQKFLVNLLSANNCHAKFVIDQLVYKFVTDEIVEWPNGVPDDSDCTQLAHVHSVIHILLKIVPMCQKLLLDSVVAQYPYLRRPTHAHELYLHNVLWVLDYEPRFRPDLLSLVLRRLVALDVNAPRHDILASDAPNADENSFLGEDTDRTRHPVAHTLDVCMDKLFNHMVMECYDMDSMQLDWERTRRFYQLLVAVFDSVLLPTYDLHHVPFVMFFLCSFRAALCEAFLAHLWAKVCEPNVAPVHRLAAVGYVASLLARAAYAGPSQLRTTLGQLADWVHAYIHAQDGLDSVGSDMRVHAVFYGVCQALFYVVAFRHRDLAASHRSLAFLEGLNLAKVVTCRLNPLQACQPAVARKFAAVTRTYQLAYCYTIIEHNARNVLPTVYTDERGRTCTRTHVTDSFFPFDPYLLRRSGKKIAAIYLEYTEPEAVGDADDRDDDDFLDSSLVDERCSKRRRFSYGTSPGFKYKS